MGRKWVLVSRICSVAFWCLGDETQQSTIFMMRLGTAGTNPTEWLTSLKFNSLWIISIWRELQLASTRNVLHGEFTLILWLHFRACTLHSSVSGLCQGQTAWSVSASSISTHLLCCVLVFFNLVVHRMLIVLKHPSDVVLSVDLSVLCHVQRQDDTSSFISFLG